MSNYKSYIQELYRTEEDPELYLKRKKESRNEAIREVVGCIVAFALLALTFTFVQVAYGVW